MTTRTMRPILAMGPICIAPALQRRGYGKRLLDFTLARAAELGFGAVCFEGNIDFYGKSGFVRASEFGIRYAGLPEGADASFFLGKELTPGYFDGVTGKYAPPTGYFVADREQSILIQRLTRALLRTVPQGAVAATPTARRRDDDRKPHAERVRDMKTRASGRRSSYKTFCAKVIKSL